MRIISKFKDYYDSGAMYGIDKERVYIRQTEELTFKFDMYIHDFDIIGFCGKLYFFDNDMPNYKNNTPKDVKYYTLHGAERLKYKFVEEVQPNSIHFPRTKKVRNLRTKKDNEDGNWAWSEYHPRKEYIEAFENRKEFLDLFLKHKVPVFWLNSRNRDDNLVLNPNLKQLGFFKVMDTVTAFQQLEMYLGSVLCDVSQPPQPVGSDEVIGRGKGFDEYSFRNAKKKPKRF